MSESEFKEAIHDWFGDEIAKDIRPMIKVIPFARIFRIRERELHPFIVPIYKKLITLDLSTCRWAQILYLILSCKCVRKQKIHQVYAQVYGTLTGTELDDDTFYILSSNDKKLWLDNYVESSEVIADPKIYAEHSKFCLSQCVKLIEFCHNYEIKIPDFNSTEYFESLNTRNLYERTPAPRNTIPLRDELRAESDRSDKNAGIEEFRTIDAVTLESEIDDPEGVILNNTETPKNLAKVNIENTKLAEDTTNRVQTPNECIRPPPANPYFSFISNVKPKYTSSPQHILEGTSTMAYNMKITDFLPKKFDPKKLESDAESHILGFKDYLCTQLNLDSLDNVEVPPQKLDLFKFVLEGEARLWYQANKPFEDIDDLEGKFLEEFVPDLKSSNTAATAFTELTFNSKMKLSSFINKILRLNRTLHYNDNVLRDRFMTAIPVDIRRLAKITRPQTFKECVAAVKSVLEDQSTEKSTVNIVGTEEMSESMQELSLSVGNMQKDIGRMTKQFNAGQNFQGVNNVRTNPNSFPQYFQYDQNYRGRPQNSRQHPRMMGNNRAEGIGQQANQRSYRGQPTNFRGRGQQFTRPTFNTTRPQIDKSRVRCFYCNKMGHYQMECWSRNNGMGYQRTGNYQQRQNNQI